MGPEYRVNADLTALEYEGVLAVFAGDRTLTWKGKDASLVFQTLRSLRDAPENARVVLEEPRIRRLLPALLEQGVLVKVPPKRSIHVRGGAVAQALAALLAGVSAGGTGFDTDPHSDSDSETLVVCLPDDYNLTEQEGALRSLREGEVLLTGFRRGSTFFLLPLIARCEYDLAGVVARLLGSEPGIGNLWLGHQLLHAREPFDAPPLSASAARWIAHDLWALITGGKLDTETARIYRGTALIREDVCLKVDGVATLSEQPECLVESLRRVVCGHARPVSGLVENALAHPVPDCSAWFATIGRPTFSVLTMEEQLVAWGAGPTRAAGALAALMEGLERYSAGCLAPGAYSLCRTDELTGPVLEPAAISCLGAGDTPRYPPHRASDRRRWQAVTCLRTGRVSFVPVELVYYPTAPETLGYLPCDETNSSGTAAHLDRGEAILRALGEVLEREAFLMAWLRKASPPRIALASLPEPLATRVAFLRRNAVETWLLNLTSDSCPIIAALMRRRWSGGCKYGIGASAHRDAAAACRKALDEATLGALASSKPPRPAEEAPEHLITPSDHLEIYASGAHDDLLLPLFETGVEQSLDEIAPFLGALVPFLLDRGHAIHVADITALLVRECVPACHVVRVIVPGFIPLRFGRQWSRTGGERLWQIPEAHGWQPRARSREELQRFPHPFA